MADRLPGSTLPRLAAFLLAALLAGCAAGPRYQTAYRYEPPDDLSGRACLEKCAHKMEGCRQDCASAYQACRTRVEPQAEERYKEAFRNYEAGLERYRVELEHYHLSLALSRHDLFWSGYGFYPGWPHPYYFPPIAPRKPNRDEVFSRVVKEQCEADCGCQVGYDACFLACGGKRIPEVKCIANCPKE